MASITWISGVDGDWVIPLDWSNGSFFIAPGASDDASIAVSGTYTVAVSSPESANSLSLSAVNATLDISSALTIGTTFAASAGTFKLENTGGIIGGKLIANGATQVWAGGTLVGLSYQGTLDLSAASASVTLAGGFVFSNSLNANGTINLTGSNAVLNALPGADVNSATINIGNHDVFSLGGTSAGTLTLDPHTQLNVAFGQTGTLTSQAFPGDTIVNAGTITSGGTLTINPSVFINNGLIVVNIDLATTGFTDNGTVTLAGGFIQANASTITVSNTGTLNGSGLIQGTVSNAGKITASGGTLQIGSLINANGRVSITSNADLQFQGAIASNVTVAFPTISNPNASLSLSDPSGFAGTITNFAVGDTIEIPDVIFGGTSAAITGSTIDVFGTDAPGTIAIPTSLAINSAVFAAAVIRNGAFDGVELYRLAQPGTHTPDPVALGNHHVGDTVSQAITITNTVANDGFSENLDASIGAASTGIKASGSFARLTPQSTDTVDLLVGVDTTASGVKSGTATISLSSDGAGVDNRGTLALNSQTVNVTGTVYAYASPTVPAVMNFGAIRLGGASPSVFSSISNGTTFDAFAENLLLNFPSFPGPFNPIMTPGTIGSGGSGTIGLSLGSLFAGDFRNTKLTVAETSQAAAGSGLSNTILTPQTITLNGEVFAPAVEAVSTQTLNFGVVHAGLPVSHSVTVTNKASAALDDALAGTIGPASVTGGFSDLTGGPGGVAVNLAAGSSAIFDIGISSDVAGMQTGTFAPVLVSHDTILPDLGISLSSVTLTGTVDNYATLAVVNQGTGLFSQNGTAATLDLGQIAFGGTVSATLAVSNAATGVADEMQTGFSVSGDAGFINSGIAGTLLAAAAAEQPHIHFTGTSVGTFTETITISATGTNDSGYSGALPSEIVTVTGTVVPPPRQMVWLGGSTDFAAAGNWNDITTNQNPAAVGPDGADTAVFNGGPAVITGTGTAASLEFAGGSGGDAWHLGAGVSLTALSSLSVDQDSVLLLTGGATISDAGAATIASGNGVDAAVDVADAGSNLAVAGSLVVGGSGFGSLSLSEGATVTAGSMGLAAGATGDGVVSVVGAGTSLSVTGSVIIGDQSSGEFDILAGAQVSIGGGFVGGTSGTGNLDVQGAGSHLTINGGTLVVGANGPAVYTLGQGTTQTGAERTAAFGVANLGGLQDPPYIINDTKSSTLINGYAGLADIAVENSGIYTVQASSGTFAPATVYTPDITVDPSTVTDSSPATGLWVIQSLGTLVLNATTVDFTQTIDFAGTNAATLVIGQAPSSDSGTLDSEGAPTITGSIAPGAPNVLPGFAAPIENYQSGDVITLQGLDYGSATASGDMVTVWSGGGGTGSVLGSLKFIDATGDASSAAALTQTSAAAAQINALACFAAGTRIETADGPVAVERLRVGDEVRTLLGGSGRIIWVGSRTVNCERHPNPETVWPVRVAAGAFGENVPVRHLYLSPDHAVFVNDVLIPAKLLVNGTTIRQMKARRVVYHHVELTRHDVLLAEGLPAETYLDTGDRAKFAGERVTDLHPDFSVRMWEAARRRLIARAERKSRRNRAVPPASDTAPRHRVRSNETSGPRSIRLPV